MQSCLRRRTVSVASAASVATSRRHITAAGGSTASRTPGKVKVTFVDAAGVKVPAEATVGDSLMRAAVNAGMDIEAACGGECRCSTCHVYVDMWTSWKLPAKTTDEEDVLSCAPLTRSSSRLSCQLKVTESMSGMTATLPVFTRGTITGGKGRR